MGKILIEIDEEGLTNHVKRICCKNIRVPAKICLVCPFRKHVLDIMRKNGWKLPVGVK